MDIRAMPEGLLILCMNKDEEPFTNFCHSTSIALEVSKETNGIKGTAGTIWKQMGNEIVRNCRGLHLAKEYEKVG